MEPNVDQYIKCNLCGYTFSKGEGIQGCKGCPVSNCNLIKCPNCGYDNIPDEMPSFDFFKRIFGKRKSNNKEK